MLLEGSVCLSWNQVVYHVNQQATDITESFMCILYLRFFSSVYLRQPSCNIFEKMSDLTSPSNGEEL